MTFYVTRRESNLLASIKVHVNVGKHKAMSCERVLKTAAQLEKEIRELLRMTA